MASHGFNNSNSVQVQHNEAEALKKFLDFFKKFEDMLDKMATSAISSQRWTSATIIICSISITVAIVWCLMKKEHINIPITYLPVATSDRSKVSPISDQNVTVSIPPVQTVVSFSQFLEETMERFLQDIARERPIRFSHQDINALTGNFTSFLGSGGYGEVYKGTFPNGVRIAVKVLKNKLSDKKVQEQFMAEIGTLGRTHHVNLVKLYGFCFDPAIKGLVYEYMENGSLDKLLFDKKRPVKWEKLLQIAIGIAKGLAYLHEECHQKIIHYDIKPGNVLLDSKLNPKVADFGLARLCNTESNEIVTFVTRQVGTPGYTAPELDKEFSPVTNKCDVYSFGVLLLEIIGRRRNYIANTSNDYKEVLLSWAWQMYKKGKLSEFLTGCDIEEESKQEAERMLMVVFLCVHHDPNERPTMSNVVKMLEGEKEIDPPSNPFKYVESSVEPSNPSSNTKVSDPLLPKISKRSPEIELMSSLLMSSK
uniref:cold-responsive protein kinase 1-like n=1 Tax=Erigeron canadensis TaxID=72917 RepID=UPI001CB9D0DA|nr:cold-responsive protein kinase 1-like [Erigeron canadensis]